jgi:endonuclease YncB( thermonuclease family)
VPAEIVRILDGDTVLVLAMPWPDQHVRVAVRLRGIDAPEMKAKCRREREAAERARSALADLAGDAGVVALYNVSGGKYFGRVLADMVTPAGIDIGPALMARGLVAAYDGGKRKPLVC